MKTDRWITFFSVRAIGLTVAICPIAQGQIDADAPADQPEFRDDHWHVNVSPYLWLAGMNGTVSLTGYQVEVKQSFGQIFENLKFGVMGFSEVRRGHVGTLMDLMYVRLGDETAVPIAGLPNALNVKTSLDSFTLTPYFAYRLLGNQRGTIDLLIGGRYYHMGAQITAEIAQVGKVSPSRSNDWADIVQGGRFQLNITPKLGAFFIGDAGGGGSDLTWQIAGGVGYRLSKRWSTVIAYRRLYFHRQTSNVFGLAQTQQGLLLGVTIHFK